MAKPLQPVKPLSPLQPLGGQGTYTAPPVTPATPNMGVAGVNEDVQKVLQQFLDWVGIQYGAQAKRDATYAMINGKALPPEWNQWLEWGRPTGKYTPPPPAAINQVSATLPKGEKVPGTKATGFQGQWEPNIPFTFSKQQNQYLGDVYNYLMRSYGFDPSSPMFDVPIGDGKTANLYNLLMGGGELTMPPIGMSTVQWSLLQAIAKQFGTAVEAVRGGAGVDDDELRWLTNSIYEPTAAPGQPTEPYIDQDSASRIAYWYARGDANGDINQTYASYIARMKSMGYQDENVLNNQWRTIQQENNLGSQAQTTSQALWNTKYAGIGSWTPQLDETGQPIVNEQTGQEQGNLVWRGLQPAVGRAYQGMYGQGVPLDQNRADLTPLGNEYYAFLNTLPPAVRDYYMGRMSQIAGAAGADINQQREEWWKQPTTEEQYRAQIRERAGVDTRMSELDKQYQQLLDNYAAAMKELDTFYTDYENYQNTRLENEKGNYAASEQEFVTMPEDPYWFEKKQYLEGVASSLGQTLSESEANLGKARSEYEGLYPEGWAPSMTDKGEDPWVAFMKKYDWKGNYAAENANVQNTALFAPRTRYLFY